MPKLNHQDKHAGLFTNSKGEQKDAYLLWKQEKGGFVIYDNNTGRILSNSAYPSIAAMKGAGVQFELRKNVRPLAVATV